MTTPKRHHYIPRFYLKRWTTDGRLWEYARRHRGSVCARQTATKGTGWQLDLYRIPGVQEDMAYEVERVFMAGIDGNAERVVHKLTMGRTVELSLNERRAFVRFLISLMLRTPEEVAKLLAKVNRYLASRPTTTERAKARRMGQELPERFSEFSGLGPHFPQQTTLQILQSLTDNTSISARLMLMNWNVIDTSKQRVRLLTSDRPIVMTNGIGRPNGHMILPLSPTHLFVAGASREVSSDIMGMTRRNLVHQVNDQVSTQAVKFVYGCDSSRRHWVDKRISTTGYHSWITDNEDRLVGFRS